MSIEGEVVAAHSHWTSDGSRIVTEATVRTDTGDVVVSQLGGSVDGIGMITMPGSEILVPGMRVAVAAHRSVDLAQREHVVLDGVRVFSYPPSYVRTGPTKSGRSLYWESGCIQVTVDEAGTSALPGDQEFALIDMSIEAWNSGTRACSYMEMVNIGREAREVGRDGVNLIKFRDTTWGRPAMGDDAARAYDPFAAGITTAVFVDDDTSDRDGAIVDADIELNGVDFAITEGGEPVGNGRCQSELRNTLTHELGHLQGLEHPCRVGRDPERVDNLGNPVPTCTAAMSAPSVPANARILEATMFNFQDCGETKKVSLSEDDINAICEIYPPRSDPGRCDPPGTAEGGCCSASGRRPDVGLLLGACAVVLTLLRRRKVR